MTSLQAWRDRSICNTFTCYKGIPKIKSLWKRRLFPLNIVASIFKLYKLFMKRRNLKKFRLEFFQFSFFQLLKLKHLHCDDLHIILDCILVTNNWKNWKRKNNTGIPWSIYSTRSTYSSKGYINWGYSLNFRVHLNSNLPLELQLLCYETFTFPIR